jgi:hypothetical protein
LVTFKQFLIRKMFSIWRGLALLAYLVLLAQSRQLMPESPPELIF